MRVVALYLGIRVYINFDKGLREHGGLLLGKNLFKSYAICAQRNPVSPLISFQGFVNI